MIRRQRQKAAASLAAFLVVGVVLYGLGPQFPLWLLTLAFMLVISGTIGAIVGLIRPDSEPVRETGTACVVLRSPGSDLMKVGVALRAHAPEATLSMDDLRHFEGPRVVAEGLADECAMKLVQALADAGADAYVVGGEQDPGAA